MPCVSSARTATTDLRDGTMVTSDGTTGRFTSAAQSLRSRRQRLTGPVAATAAPKSPGPDICRPRDARIRGRVAAQDVDGLGLLRAKYMLTEALGGRRPRDLIAHREKRQLVDAMAATLVASPRPSHRVRWSIAQQTP